MSQNEGPIPDHYKILQVHHNAGQEIIEAAYKRLCKIYHPDINRNPHAERRIREINISYGILRDPTLRSEYHVRWLQSRHNRARIQPNGDPSLNDAAYAVLDGYFQDLMDGLFDDAYLRLTLGERAVVPHADFVTWQRHVARIYRIGSYRIKPFRCYTDCRIGDITFPEVREFSVHISDMDMRTGALSENSFVKYVALEEGAWHVCLGYRDLKPLIKKYRYMQENPSNINLQVLYNEEMMNRDALTGKLSRIGFLKQAEKELLRSRRYGNVFTVALFGVMPVDAREFTNEDVRYAVTVFAKVFDENTRNMDFVGRWSNNEMVALFPETGEENASVACRKLCDAAGVAGEEPFGIRFGVSSMVGDSIEDAIYAASVDATRREEEQECPGMAVTEIYPDQTEGPDEPSIDC
jgi:GGDEF domain-containing protein